MDKFKEFLLNLDPNILYIIVIIAVIIVVGSIIKKAIKLAIFCIAIAILFIFFSSSNSSFKEQYNIKTEDNAIIVTLDGEEHIIADIDNIQNVTISKVDDKNINIKLTYTDKDMDLNAPIFIESTLIKVLDKYEIKYEKIE